MLVLWLSVMLVLLHFVKEKEGISNTQHSTDWNNCDIEIQPYLYAPFLRLLITSVCLGSDLLLVNLLLEHHLSCLSFS